MPELSPRPLTSAAFRQFLDEDQLMGDRCADCGAVYLPPRAICPRCYGENLAWVPLSGRGRLAAFTSVFVGSTAMQAEGFDRSNPYCAGIVELEEGVRISARILGVDARDPAGIRIGTPMLVEFLHRGEGDARTTSLAFRACE